MKHSTQSYIIKDKKKIHHRVKRPIEMGPLEETSLDEIINEDGNEIEVFDPHFKSELDYDGYSNVEEYENHEFHINEKKMGNPENELVFDGGRLKTELEDEDSIER